MQSPSSHARFEEKPPTGSWSSEDVDSADRDRDFLLVADAVWEQRRTLKFVDRRIEDRYARELYGPRRNFYIRAFLFFAVVGVFDFMFNGYWLRLQQTDWTAIVTVWTRIANILEFVVWAMLLKCDAVSPEVAIAIGCMMQPVLLTTATTYRIATLMEPHSQYYQGLLSTPVFLDDSFYALTMLLPCFAPLVVTLRISYSWTIVPWSMVLYLLSSVVAGPVPMSVAFLNFAFMTFLGYFLFHGSYRVERELRWKWSHALQLEIANVIQRSQIQQHQRWHKDLEERLEVLNGSVSDGVKTDVCQIKTRCDSDIVLASVVPIPFELPTRGPPLSKAALVCDNLNPNELLATSMHGRTADAQRLRKMALHISEESYSLRDFFEDAVATFPELELFIASQGRASSSGNSAAVEYQRTFGALNAVYWLLRLDTDGKDGFCFGYDGSWNCIRFSQAIGHSSMKKRAKFCSEMEWDYVADVVSSSLQGSVDRIEAMLSLTAIHDIMKVPELCPTVAQEHSPYEGYLAGERINDHDLALAYVLEYYPHLLPSYSVLPQASRDVVLFTQSKMHFNHGWFVQAEAPPFIMLSKFKAVLAKALPEDLSFYFLQWLTDLSGAEGRPLAGAEKFVLHFPRAVLSSFIWSIPYLQHLTDRSETEVVESYLLARYRMALPAEPEPVSCISIAIMRLVVMAQSSGHLIPRAFATLPVRGQTVLAEELARTGHAEQQFASSPQSGGPAFFVYYGPALLQRCQTHEEMRAALTMLALVYGAARDLWPLEEASSGCTVTLDGGTLKANATSVVSGEVSVQGKVWVMQPSSNVEATITLQGGCSINAMRRRDRLFWVLDPDELNWDGVMVGRLQHTSV